MCHAVNIQWLFIEKCAVPFHWSVTKWWAFLLANLRGCGPVWSAVAEHMGSESVTREGVRREGVNCYSDRER